MKALLVAVIVLAVFSTAGAQQAYRPEGGLDMAGLIGYAVGALVGSTIGDGRGQTLATGAGALVGGVIGEAISPRRAAAPKNDLVKQLDEHRSSVIEAAVSGKVPMPRKAPSVRRRGAPLSQCQEIAPGTFSCQDATGAWRILR